jgi:hypothetical protein
MSILPGCEVYVDILAEQAGCRQLRVRALIGYRTPLPWRA